MILKNKNKYYIKDFLNILIEEKVIDKSLLSKLSSNNSNNKKSRQQCLYLSEIQFNMLKSFFIKHYNSNKYYKNLLKDICKIRKENYGKINEALLYYCLHECCINFAPQKKIDSLNSFKSVKYDADGIIDNRIIFDIKSFDIPFNVLENFKKTMEQKIFDFCQKYYNVNMDTTIDFNHNKFNIYFKKVTKDCTKLDLLIKEIFKTKAIHDCHVYTDKETGIKFTIYNNNKLQPNGSYLSLDFYQWAEANQYLPMLHSSQFIRNQPYILFYTFDNNFKAYFSGDRFYFFQVLRSFSRRVFIALNKCTSEYINSIDHKAIKDISVSQASRKISAIVFINIDESYEYNKLEGYAFINPNAENKLYNYEVNKIFTCNGFVIDDFKYDNY